MIQNNNKGMSYCHNVGSTPQLREHKTYTRKTTTFQRLHTSNYTKPFLAVTSRMYPPQCRIVHYVDKEVKRYSHIGETNQVLFGATTKIQVHSYDM